MPSPEELVYFSLADAEVFVFLQRCRRTQRLFFQMSTALPGARVFTEELPDSVLFVQRAAGLPSHPDIEKVPP